MGRRRLKTSTRGRGASNNVIPSASEESLPLTAYAGCRDASTPSDLASRSRSPLSMTKILLSKRLCDADFGVRTVHLPQGFADFAHGGVSADRIHNVGHGIGGRDRAVRTRLRFLGGSFLQGIERAARLFIRAPRTQIL